MVTDFVQENSQTDRAFGTGGFDPVDTPPVMVIHTPGATGHGFSPFVDPDIIFSFQLIDDRVVIGHATGMIGRVGPFDESSMFIPNRSASRDRLLSLLKTDGVTRRE